MEAKRKPRHTHTMHDGHPPHKSCVTPSFRLLDLPRELRDRIYELLLAREVILLGPYPLSTMEPSSRSVEFEARKSGVNILRTCRQVYQESKPILYSHSVFIFKSFASGYDFSAKYALSFLKEVVPKDVRTKVRSLHFGLQERLQEDGHTDIVGWNNENFEKLCTLLGSEYQLRHLNLRVQHMRCFSRTLKEIFNKGGKPYGEVPAWAKFLSTIKKLDRLTLHWEYVNLKCLRRTLASVKLLRSTIVQHGDKLQGNDGIIVRLRHDTGMRQGIRARYWGRHMVLEMDIDKAGNSTLEHKRRVKVLPDTECSTCAHYPSKAGGICACGTPVDLDRLSDATKPTAHTSCRTDGMTVQHQEKNPESKAWNQKPLEEYLPEDVTEQDLYNARALRNAGFHLCLWQGKSSKSRTYATDSDSDFGDTDSLLSIHEWSDGDEEVE